MSRRLGDDDMERILTGRVPSDDSWRALAEALSIPPDEVPPDLAARHISAIAAAAREATHLAAPAARRPRRLLARGALSGVVAKILLGAAVAVAATGGAAATGVLPDPLQDAIADGAARLGLHVPHATPPSLTTPTTSPGSSTTTTMGGIGDSATTSTPVVVALTPYRWASTSCAGLPLAVEAGYGYGTLLLEDVTGATDEVDTDSDRIEIWFSDGVRLRIDLPGDAPVVTEDRACGGEAGGGAGASDDDDDDDSESDDDASDTDDASGGGEDDTDPGSGDDDQETPQTDDPDSSDDPSDDDDSETTPDDSDD